MKHPNVSTHLTHQELGYVYSQECGICNPLTATEERVTSSSGGQKGKKPEAFGGGDPLAYIELAKVYAMGEAKYDRYNYLKGYEWSLSIDALFRHLFAFLAGEERDPESGLLHTSHVAWHAQTLTSFQLRGLRQFDDRAPGEATQVQASRITEDPERCACHVKAEVDYRGEWPPDTRIAGQLVCCGGTEVHLLSCSQYRPQ